MAFYFYPPLFEEKMGDVVLASSVRPDFFRPESYLRNGLKEFNETLYKCLILWENAALQV